MICPVLSAYCEVLTKKYPNTDLSLPDLSMSKMEGSEKQRAFYLLQKTIQTLLPLALDEYDKPHIKNWLATFTLESPTLSSQYGAIEQTARVQDDDRIRRALGNLANAISAYVHNAPPWDVASNCAYAIIDAPEVCKSTGLYLELAKSL